MLRYRISAPYLAVARRIVSALLRIVFSLAVKEAFQYLELVAEIGGDHGNSADH